MPIRLITTRDHIRSVARRWDRQYKNYQYDEGKMAIGKRLAALDVETSTPEDVAKIIGNTSWVGEDCDNCKKPVDRYIQIGEEPNYDARYVNLCGDCLELALQTLKSNR